MRKLGFALMIVVLAATVSVAQNRGGNDFDPKERAEKEVETLTEKFELSKDQQTKVYDVILKGSNEMVKMRKEASGDRDAMREKMMSLRKEQNTELKKILSDSQWESYTKYQQERRSQRGNRGGGGGGQR